MVDFWTDITERKRSEEELRRSNAELEQFAYVASHDLKEPLRMVSQYLTLLDRRHAGDLPETARGWVEQAIRGTRRMQELIEDLLTYSRAGRAVEPTDPIALQHVVDQIKEVLAIEIERSGAIITTSNLPTVHFERTKIIQLLQNLIGNAIKFRAPGVSPRIHIAATRQEDHWEFSVTDNGIGIDEQQSQRVFELFQRLHARESYPGTGIGLAICRRIVEQHGGRIWAEPADGHGTVFRFTLRAEHVVGGPPE